MKKLLLLLLVCTMVSCGTSETAKRKFKQKGITIQCPEGWCITDEDSLGGSGYYLAIEKEGFNASGLWSLTWVEGEITAEDFLASMQEGISDNIVYKNSDLKMSAPFTTTFGNKEAVASSYTCSMLGLKHEGVIYSFYGEDKVISVLKQGAVEDKKGNDEGFEFLEKNFSSK